MAPNPHRDSASSQHERNGAAYYLAGRGYGLLQIYS